ncbi:MAG: hypothetical protein AAGB48_07465 [Planctomycetota bacterium]
MERIQQYLDVVPLPLLGLGAIAAAMVFLLIPPRLRLPSMLIFMVVWVTVSRLSGLGIIAGVAKVSAVGAYLAVAVAAQIDPGPKRPVPPVGYIYPLMAFVSILFILTVTDVSLALALRVQWIALVFAAIAVARTVVDAASLMRVLAPIVIGLVISTGITMAPLLLNPGDAFRAGLGRFEPYGASSNQIGVAFSMMIVFGFLGMQLVRNIMYKVVLGGAAGAALGMGLLTGSRSTMITAIVPLIPQLRGLIKRPVVLVLVGILAVSLIPFVLGKSEDNTFKRFGSLETSRVQIFVQYVTGSIAERPLLGLTGTTGQSFIGDDEADSHSHNAYLDLAYQGGIIYLFPMLVVVGYTFYCMLYTWKNRRLVYDVEPLMISVLAVQLGMMYAHGFVNGAIYYPTYVWAFVHVLLSLIFMGMAHDIKLGGFGIRTGALGLAYSDADSYGDYDDADYGQHQYGQDEYRESGYDYDADEPYGPSQERA